MRISFGVLLARVVWVLLAGLVTVSALPRIEIPPQPTTVQVRKSTILMCKVVDKEMYSVNWIKDNVVISTDGAIDSTHVSPTRYSIVGNPIEGNYNLQITNIRTSDASPFQCQLEPPASGGPEIPPSDPVDLIVQHPPGEGYPQCSPDLRSVTDLSAGTEVKFGCSTVRGEPAALIVWKLDGKEVNSTLNEERPGFIQRNFVKNVGIEDNGKVFICNLTHLLLPEPRECQVGPLDVLFPPQEAVIKTTQPRPKVGGVLVLNCETRANPMVDLSYTWHVIPPSQEAAVGQKGRITDSGVSVWVLSGVQEEDDGTVVVCEVRNFLGALNASFTISIFTRTTPPPLPTFPLLPSKAPVNPTTLPLTPKPLTGDSIPPYIIILILTAVSLLLLSISLVIFVVKRKKQPVSAVITVTDLDNIHADVHSLASFGPISRQGTPYLDRVDYELNRSRSHSRDMFDSVSLDSASALVTRSQSRDSPTHRKYSVDSLGKPLYRNDHHYREHRNDSPVHHAAKRLDSSPVKDRKPSDSCSQAGRPLPPIAGPVQQNEYAELTPISARKHYNESQMSVTSPESGYGEDDVLIKPLASSTPLQSSNNCNCGRKLSHVEV